MGNKRYRIYMFPSLYGTPWQTDNRAWAWVLFYARCFVAGIYEVRMIDHQENKLMALN